MRRLHQEAVEITPEFKLVLSGNYKPEIRGGDDGIWRRILLIGFDVQIPEDEVDMNLLQTLWQERDDIFAWMIEGALDYLNNGLKVPAAVLSETSDYREDSDPFAFFVDRFGKFGDPNARILARDLIDAFRLKQKDDGDSPFTNRTASRGFAELSRVYKGPNGERINRVKASDIYYTGISLPEDLLERLHEVRPL